MEAFAGRLGGEVVPHTYPNPGNKPFHALKAADESEKVIVFGTTPIPIANHWHTDLTYVTRPPAVGLLRPVVLPSVGGDTLWANTAAGYADLPPKLRELCDPLQILHANIRNYVSPFWIGTPEKDYTLMPEPDWDVQETIHPLVRVHPFTGERCLIVGSFARHILGFSSLSMSAELVRTLQDYITRPDNTLRWTWQMGDLVMFDNRTTQHYGVYDYGKERRLMERASTIDKELPVGINGFRSRPTKTSKEPIPDLGPDKVAL